MKKFKKDKGKKKKLAKIVKKTKEIVQYEPCRCKFIKKNGEQCECKAVGSSTLCEKHGGSVIIKSNLIKHSDIPRDILKEMKFDPAYHPMAYINLSKRGLSKFEIAAEFGVSVVSLGNWEKKFVEMQTAMEIGADLHTAWWIRNGKGALEDNRYNNSMFKFLTGNLLGFSDKIEQKNTNMNVHGVLVVPNSVTPEEWQKQAIEMCNNDGEIIDGTTGKPEKH